MPDAAPTPSPIGYRFQLLRAGPLWLDGGGMFGLIPRPVWMRKVTPDARGRIPLAHNCLLLDRIDRPHRILIETGSGDKFDAAARDMYGLGEVNILDALRGAGCAPETIDDVILSHLHFDHVGGLTRTVRDREAADWTGVARPQGVKLTFPRVAIHVQRREWEDAIANRSVMTRTYLPENLFPLRDHLRLLDAPMPFPQGYIPRRDEEPATSVGQREREILPGIFGLVLPGHTWGQQAIRFVDDGGRNIVFTPDVLPTANHVGATYNLAYDVEAFMSTVTRKWFLRAALENHWHLMLNHERGYPFFRVEEDGKGWFSLVPVAQALGD